MKAHRETVFKARQENKHSAFVLDGSASKKKKNSVGPRDILNEENALQTLWCFSGTLT